MANYCKLTGIDLEKEECPIKKMCLNCKFCIENEDGTFACRNKNVLNIAKEKIMAAVPEGYEIENISLKPMALKNPIKKCPNYEVDVDLIHDEVEGHFIDIVAAES